MLKGVKIVVGLLAAGAQAAVRYVLERYCALIAGRYFVLRKINSRRSPDTADATNVPTVFYIIGVRYY